MIRQLSLSVLLGSPAWTQPPPPPLPAPFALLQGWAGPDAAGLGFTQDQLLAFLQARSGDLRAARSEPWSGWLKRLEGASRPSLQAWALARRVEAGDYAAYPAFMEAVTEHLLGISKPGSGRSDRIISDPPSDRGVEKMPEALRLDHASPFWASLRKTLLADPKRQLNPGLYSIWCYGTHPDQKDLILELARRAEASATVQNPSPDPWNDPRFWIVLDWTLAWSTREDRAELQAALAEGPVRKAFGRALRSVEGIPAFFPERPAAPTPPAAQAPGEPAAKAPALPVRFDFTQIRVKVQPGAPGYPVEAKQRRLMTNLVLDIVVDPEGKPVSCRPLPGPWLAFFAATGAAYGLEWRFHPARLDGVPQTARFRLTMPFRLRN